MLNDTPAATRFAAIVPGDELHTNANERRVRTADELAAEIARVEFRLDNALDRGDAQDRIDELEVELEFLNAEYQALKRPVWKATPAPWVPDSVAGPTRFVGPGRDRSPAFEDNAQFRAALKEMAEHVEHRERQHLGERDWRVLLALYKSAARYGWKVVPGAAQWLANQTKLSRTGVQRALKSLAEGGWLTPVAWDEVPDWSKRSAIRRQRKQGGSRPNFFKLPTRYVDVPDFATPLDDLPWGEEAWTVGAELGQNPELSAEP